MSIVGAVIVPHPPAILPEVGRGQEAELAKTAAAFQTAAGRLASWAPDTLVFFSPHTVAYQDYFHISPGSRAEGNFAQFGTPSLRLEAEYDAELVERICVHTRNGMLPAGTFGEQDPALDHGVAVPLYFFQKELPDCKIVRIGLSGMTPLDHYRMGKCVAAAAGDLGRRVAIVASGDLSHKLKEDGPYGFAPQGPVFDEQIIRAMAAGDFLSFLTMDETFAMEAAQCGLNAFQMMAGALDGRSVEPELLSYEGPFGVGYAVGVFAAGAEDPARRMDEAYQTYMYEASAGQRAAEDAYVRLARLSLETYVNTGRRAELPADLPDEMTGARAGVFVSIHQGGRLRGCIGTVYPVTRSVAEEILRNAVAAGHEDNRFPPVRKEELVTLTYSVDVLGVSETVYSREDLDPKRYGVVVTGGRRRGLLLPNLDGVETVEQQLEIACQKAGIDVDSSYTMERFEVVRHG